MVLFGLHMTGLIRIPFLQYDVRRQEAPDKRLGYASSFLLGVFFSAGWSPCVGPILGTILTLSLSTGSLTQGFWLLVAYSIGLAIPFLIAAVEIGLVTSFIKKYGNVVRYVEIAMGIVMIVIGVLLFFGRFEQVASLGFFFGSVDEVRVGIIILAVIGLLIILGLIPAFIAKSKGRKVELEDNKMGHILRINDRKSSNYYRVYSKNNFLEFELEMKKDALKSIQSIFFFELFDKI